MTLHHDFPWGLIFIRRYSIT